MKNCIFHTAILYNYVMTFLGFDFGLKRIGIAVGQDITGTASPLKTINVKNGEPDWEELTAIIAAWHPAALIVGVPLNMDRTSQPLTSAARDFAEKLKKNYNISVYEVDERLTTKTARSDVFSTGGYKALQKEEIDSVAAKIILETWMHKNCG